MIHDLIPESTRQFIFQYIDSIAQWEGLLLLRSDRTQEWQAGTLATRLYVTSAEADTILTQLALQGFLAVTEGEKSPRYHYNAAPKLDGSVQEVAELYSKYLVPITHLIHSKPKNRIQKFADAFRIRRDK